MSKWPVLVAITGIALPLSLPAVAGDLDGAYGGASLTAGLDVAPYNRDLEGSLFVGYNYALSSDFVVGAEADVTSVDISDLQLEVVRRTAAQLDLRMDFLRAEGAGLASRNGRAVSRRLITRAKSRLQQLVEAQQETQDRGLA